MQDIHYPLTIYYDASCPLCQHEMATLKAFDQHNQLTLVNCADKHFTIGKTCPVTKEAMMSRIYAVDANGRWLSSMDVFAATYAASGFHGLSRLWASKRLRPIFNRLYPWIADNRRWLSKTPIPRLLSWSLKLIAKQ